MPNKRVLILCVMLALTATMLQAAPRILGNAFVFLTVIGGFPIYIAARLNSTLGMIVFLAASFLTAAVNLGEAIFFICTNGIIGLSLGITRNGTAKTCLVPIPASIIVIAMLFSVNRLLDISIFGYSGQKTHMMQTFTLILPLYIYSYIYLKLSEFLYNALNNSIELDRH